MSKKKPIQTHMIKVEFIAFCHEHIIFLSDFTSNIV